jgi:hypothetical protein
MHKPSPKRGIFLAVSIAFVLAPSMTATPEVLELSPGCGVPDNDLPCPVPNLPELDGWYRLNLHPSNVLLLPVGTNLKDKGPQIYAVAIDRPSLSGLETLDKWISRDKRSFGRSGDVEIVDAPDLRTADGRTFRTVTYISPPENLWLRIAYGEEGDYFITIALQTSTRAAYQAAVDDYERLVALYK